MLRATRRHECKYRAKDEAEEYKMGDSVSAMFSTCDNLPNRRAQFLGFQSLGYPEGPNYVES